MTIKSRQNAIIFKKSERKRKNKEKEKTKKKKKQRKNNKYFFSFPVKLFDLC